MGPPSGGRGAAAGRHHRAGSPRPVGGRPGDAAQRRRPPHDHPGVAAVPRHRGHGCAHRVPAPLAARRRRGVVAGLLRGRRPDARHRHAALGAGALLLRPLQRHGVGPGPQGGARRHRGRPGADVRLAGLPVPPGQRGRADQRGPRGPEPLARGRRPHPRRDHLHVHRQHRLLRRSGPRRSGRLERRSAPRPARHADRHPAEPGGGAQGARRRRRAAAHRPRAARRRRAPRLRHGRAGRGGPSGARRRPAGRLLRARLGGVLRSRGRDGDARPPRHVAAGRPGRRPARSGARTLRRRPACPGRPVPRGRPRRRLHRRGRPAGWGRHASVPLSG